MLQKYGATVEILVQIQLMTFEIFIIISYHWYIFVTEFYIWENTNTVRSQMIQHISSTKKDIRVLIVLYLVQRDFVLAKLPVCGTSVVDKFVQFRKKQKHCSLK